MIASVLVLAMATITQTPESVFAAPKNKVECTDNSEFCTGTNGNDQIKARGGNDLIDGNAGDDQIKAGKGNDQMAGQTGADKFNCGSGNDQVIFFNPAEGDKATGNCEDVRPGR